MSGGGRAVARPPQARRRPARRRLKRLGKLPLDDALHIAAQLASALAATHAYGIVHRDTKPYNILLVSNPAVSTGEQAKIVDFGIANLGEDDGRRWQR